jgi:Zn finger protein HypA/HybF involved in hydrogenase expression
MHELHLIHDLVNDILEIGNQKNIKKINRVYIQMGHFSEIDPDILKFHFKENSTNTILENATIDITRTNQRELKLISIDCE